MRKRLVFTLLLAWAGIADADPPRAVGVLEVLPHGANRWTPTPGDTSYRGTFGHLGDLFVMGCNKAIVEAGDVPVEVVLPFSLLKVRQASGAPAPTWTQMAAITHAGFFIDVGLVLSVGFTAGLKAHLVDATGAELKVVERQASRDRARNQFAGNTLETGEQVCAELLSRH